MECNKEEAIRAKGIAEQKMQNKDFGGARKIVLKAQQLYKDLENVSQMLMVCDVHCSAEKKIAGNEMDWYEILQIEQMADDATIKKQYRKFALLLHPDKNKFPGAEAAFKLIGEAQRVLLDKGKRSLLDTKRKAYVSKPARAYWPPPRPTYSHNVGVQSNYRGNPAGFNSQSPQQAGQPGFTNGRATFWTACPFCNVKYQYYVQVMNKSIICQTCNKPFVAYERTFQGTATATNINRSAFPERRNVPSQGFQKVDLTKQGHSAADHSKTEFFQKKFSGSDLGSQKVNGKRRKKNQESDESSESCDAESSIDAEDDMHVDEDGKFKAGVNLGGHAERLRRSDRRKQRVSYKENHSDDEDDDFPSHPKKTKGNRPEEEHRNRLKEDLFEKDKELGVKDQSGRKQKENPDIKNAKGKEKSEENSVKESSQAHIDLEESDSSSNSTSDAEFYDCPDPDFNDFDKFRSDGCFSAGQIWAVYDTVDAMPRFYARIRKVFSPDFKLRITWLEPNPDDGFATEWVQAGLPASCGKFKNGSSDYTQNRLTFSHKVTWEKGTQRETYKIFPRKGEIWAVFKNWNVNWKSDTYPDQKYEYEFVEILSEYTEGAGVSVVYLGKLKGFVSVFCRIRKGGKATSRIPPAEIFRFSHIIPSFNLSGEERQGVPKGSFELDPAALPRNIKEVPFSEDLVVEIGGANVKGQCPGSPSDEFKAENESDDLEPGLVSEDPSSPDSVPDEFVIPEAEFSNFDAEKSIDKFKVGQIWSLYSDDDGLPKYYGRITKVATNQGFELQLKWLKACGLPQGVICWRDKKMPICCGRFKFDKGATETYNSNGSFSHQLSVEPADKKNQYTIMPKEGQIWALYRNWSAEMKLSDLGKGEYDVVEVINKTDLQYKVWLLEQVDGFNSVFKPEIKGGSAVTMDVSFAELLRFSHQIPAFKLTNENNGNLKDYWELDPAALPVHFFSLK